MFLVLYLKYKNMAMLYSSLKICGDFTHLGGKQKYVFRLCNPLANLFQGL